jgi:RNA polymerase sigma-70 factor (ECF subfamily)
MQKNVTVSEIGSSYNRGMDSTSLNVDGADPDDPAADSLQVMFERYRPRLKMVVEMRIDRRIRARVDASDIVQDALADAVRRFAAYQQERKLSPYIWLRFLTLQQLLLAHRKHLGVKARSALVERPLAVFRACGVESESITECLMGSESSPSVKAQRNESVERLNKAIEQMDELDREILVLRHFEKLEFKEVAEAVGLSLDAVSSRYRRGLKKLGAMITDGNPTRSWQGSHPADFPARPKDWEGGGHFS